MAAPASPRLQPIEKARGLTLQEGTTTVCIKHHKIKDKTNILVPCTPSLRSGGRLLFSANPQLRPPSLPPSLLSVYTMKTSALLDTFTARATNPTDRPTRLGCSVGAAFEKHHWRVTEPPAIGQSDAASHNILPLAPNRVTFVSLRLTLINATCSFLMLIGT